MTMNNCLKLKDVFKSFVDSDNFIFKRISTTALWYNATLDFEYLYSHSGDKFISPLVQKLLSNDNTITTVNLDKLANVIKNRYLEKWNKVVTALKDNYNPLENYNMVEVETPNITRAKHTETNVDMTVSGNANSQSNIYGFNTTSEDGVPNASANGNNSTRTFGDDEGNYSDVTDTETGTKRLVRNGNIGVTTSQQMLEQELEIRKNLIEEIMFEDVDKILTLDIYE